MTNKNLEDTFNDLSEAIMTDSENESFVGVQDEANIVEQGVDAEEPGRAVTATELGIVGGPVKTVDDELRDRLAACEHVLQDLNVEKDMLVVQIGDMSTERAKLWRLVSVLDRIDKTGGDE